MKQFEQKFKEDASDLLKTLEEDLLLLKNKPKNKNLTDSVFRSLHTLKGSGEMFGFKYITTLSHELESIYELIQSNKLVVNEQIIKLTFSAIDYYKYLLENKTFLDNETKERFLKLLKIISNISNKNTHSENLTTEQQMSSGEKTYYIMFTPKADFEQRGINLFTIFEELEKIGTVSLFERETNADNNVNEEYFFMFWEIILSTEIDFSELESIFIFFANQVEIELINESNLFELDEFNKKIEEFKQSENLLDLELLKNIKPVKTLKKQEEHTEDLSIDDVAVSQQDNNFTFSKYKTTSIRVEASRLDELMNLVSEFITTKATISLITEKYKIKELDEITDKLEKLAKKFQENALTIRLVPIRNMLVDIERLVINLSKKLGKEVEFVSQGTDTELDKNIIDNLSEPIMHIIRNTLDHGIELPEDRLIKNKATKGEIKFIAFHAGGNVFIQIHDDGRGIDIEQVRKKAISNGTINENDKLSKNELLNFVFTPGFSTSKQVTKVSGRGMGMDIVRQKIQNLRGDVEINSEKDLGTYITLRLPVTLSILDTLHIKIGIKNFLIPTYLLLTVHLEKNLSLLNSTRSMIEINGETIHVLNLIKRYSKLKENKDFVNIVVVKYKDTKYGLIVSEVTGDHQAVLKPLGPIFNQQENFSGASVLGNGKIALIFNTNKLITDWQ